MQSLADIINAKSFSCSIAAAAFTHPYTRSPAHLCSQKKKYSCQLHCVLSGSSNSTPGRIRYGNIVFPNRRFIGMAYRHIYIHIYLHRYALHINYFSRIYSNLSALLFTYAEFFICASTAVYFMLFAFRNFSKILTA